MDSAEEVVLVNYLLSYQFVNLFKIELLSKMLYFN